MTALAGRDRNADPAAGAQPDEAAAAVAATTAFYTPQDPQAPETPEQERS